ncbi:ATP-grasp domain-containing protein [Streptomyces tendae]|uniref:ATP-grasp domain-containing protein n=1 Tax=Streptomyces tendae TaxID=1932 RepID=UPI0024916F2D|nr:hypothetical protein [Streptomyces tendae]
MHVVVMQRPHSKARYDHWLKQANPHMRVTIFSSTATVRPDADLASDVRRVLVADYESPAAFSELLATCADDVPDRIVVNSERDVLRAAEVRTLLGIKGQKSGVALLFRDKIRMKSLFAGLTIPPVPHAVLGCLDDLLAFQRHVGSVVVKPRDGVGSMGVRVCHDEEGIRRCFTADAAYLEALHRGGLMAEKFVPGSVYHVDVVVVDDRPVLISPSRYTSPPHKFATDNLGSVMLDESSAMYGLLHASATEFVGNLPHGHGAGVLHLEYLEDAEGRLHFGEVACRVGGALVKNAVSHTYGVDISKLACLTAAGCYVPAVDMPRVGLPSGWILNNGGAAVSSSGVDFPWVVESDFRTRDGAPANSVDAAARFLVEGRDEHEIEQRLQRLFQ